MMMILLMILVSDLFAFTFLRVSFTFLNINKYSFEVLVLLEYFYVILIYTSTLLHFRGKYFIFYSNTFTSLYHLLFKG